MGSFPNIPIKNYHDVRPDIRSGDLLLCSGSSVFSNLIQTATNSKWSHVAFVLRLDAIGRIIVLESVESIGVRAVILNSYVRDYNGTGLGYPGKIMLARHQDVKAEKIINLSKYATNLLGYPYGKEEIARIASRICLNKIGVHFQEPEPPAKKEFICSEYVAVCMQSIGINISFDELGFIAPADFVNQPKVKPLFFLQSQNEKVNEIMHA